MPAIEFWYEFASTYSYPAAMRIERMAKAAGVAVRWRPFLLGPIFAAQGWSDSPFNLYPAKGRYMWRDLARICAREEIPLTLPPARFPQNGLKAARLALAGEAEGWTAQFSRAVYTANFAQQKDISDDSTLADILKGLGIDAHRAFAGAAASKDRLKAQTEEAQARGIFGAPSFTVGEELFWGNDRLEEAVNLAADPSKILSEELARTDPAIVARLQPLLVDPPRFSMAAWDHHAPHEAAKHLPCWIVLQQSSLAIAYSPCGFGPSQPWGLLWLKDGMPSGSMGQDSAWFATLAGAFDEFSG
jgi:2-hydroxychromene-2-carboxylate isomerase